MKRDIEILSQTFERIIDRKEAITKSLVKDIEEAEEQYEMALRSHLQNQDHLIGVVLIIINIAPVLWIIVPGVNTG